MGYRSDVGLTFTNEALGKIYNRIPAGLKKELEDAAVPRNENNEYIKSFFLPGVKWYDAVDPDISKFINTHRKTLSLQVRDIRCI